MQKCLRQLIDACCLSVIVVSLAIAQDKQPASRRHSTFTEELRAEQEKLLEAGRLESESEAKRLENFGQTPVDLPDALRQDFEKRRQEFQDGVAELRKIYLRHQVAWSPDGDLARLRLYGEQLNRTQRALDLWRASMAEAYLATKAEDVRLRETMTEMLMRDSSKGLYEGLQPMARALWQRSQESLTEELIGRIGMISLANNDHQLTKEAWTRLGSNSDLKPAYQNLLKSVDAAEAHWPSEKRQREQDLSRNNNPHVSLLTNRGLFVIELFEDQAPETVANFIYLVERHFYDGRAFFVVMEYFGAQSGCDANNGTGNAGYTIRGEASREDRRSVCRGSLFLVSGLNENTNAHDPDSGSSQFVISAFPQPNLDGQQTVFGRVLEGQQLLGMLTRIDLTKEEDKKSETKIPDLIIEAKVERKRDHPYKPTPVRGRLPE